MASFALYPMARRYKNWKYNWEESYLLNSDAYIFPKTFRNIAKIYKTLGERYGVKFEHECYDTGHLYNLAHCIDRGLFKPPVFLRLIFGIPARQRVRRAAVAQHQIRGGVSATGTPLIEAENLFR